ncbi:MAG: hypothetical protein J1F01_05600 [Oscillospiraceae bacterium]|nr:hypothetical protein [Oscillospiraceae bacterium]
MPSGAAAMIAAINERTKEFAKMDIKCETSKPFASEAEYTKFEEDYCKSCFKNKNGIYCKTREACKNSLQNEWIVDMVCDGIKYPHICQLFDEKGVTRTLTGEIV